MAKPAKSIKTLFAIPVSSLFGLCVATVAFAAPQVTFEFQSMFGKQGFYTATNPPNAIPPDGFSGPTGITYRADGKVIVADRGNLKLQLCDTTGSCQWIGNDVFLFRNSPGLFDLPHGVGINSVGLIGVADEDNHAVQLCTETASCKYSGQTNSENNPPSSALGRWAFPSDIAFDSTDRVYGLDTKNNRVQVLNAVSLQFISVWGGQGSGLGKFNEPKGIAIDQQDRVIISDTGNNRIQICSLSGSNCTAFGSKGSGVGKFSDPVGVEVDALGRIWVADAGNHRIQVCDYSGSCKAFGEMGNGQAQFNAPTDMAFHPSGQVAVVDSNNNRIQFFKTESAFQINAGLNDAWFNPATPGQGFFITVFPAIEMMFVANFTFDTELPDGSAPANLGDEGQRWLTGFGPFSGTRAVLDIELTSGGTFDSAVPAVTQEAGYGTFTVDFTSCSSGSISYEIPTLGLQGIIPIVRLAPDNVTLCEALNP